MVNQATPLGTSPVQPPDPEYDSVNFDIQAYGRTLWRWRVAALGVVAATLTLAVAYTFLTRPVYETETLLLLEDKNAQPQILSDSSAGLGALGGADFSTQINTQIQVLSRRPLVNKALLALRPRYPELKEQDVDDIIRRLTISQVTRTQVVSVAFKDTDPQLVKDMLQALGRIYIDYSLDVQKSKVSGAIRFIETELPKVRGTVEDAEESLRAFRKQYNILDPQEQGAELSRTLNTINRDVESARVELGAADANYRSLRTRLGASPGQALASATLSEDVLYQGLLKQLQEIETQLVIEKTRFRDDYPTVQSLIAKRAQLQALIAEQSRKILGTRVVNRAVLEPSLQDSLTGGVTRGAAASQGSSVNDRLGDLQVRLVDELLKAENQYRVQVARVSGLEDAKKRLAGQFQLVPSQAKRYQELNRNSVIAAESLTRLLQRLQELKIQEAQEISPWRVIEPAVLPEKPVWPKPLLTLGVGGLLSIVLGLLAASLLDVIDDRIKSIDQAKELLKLPLLGAIPYSEDLSLAPGQREAVAAQKAAQDQPAKGKQGSPYSRSPYKEAFRSLLTNLRFLSSDRKMNVFVLSSSAPGEGKSTVSSNLAVIAGELNRKVLLIDADLRRPTVAKQLELSNVRGLSSILSGEMRWQEVVQKFDENTHILTSGPIPPNPVTLLDSTRMAELISQWREEYDLVLIDSPPLIGLTDATLLSKYADGLIMVVGLDTARRGGLKGALERLKSAGVTPVGMIANALRQESEGYYYYYQYYYHYYGEPTPDQTKSSKKTKNRK